MKKQHTALLAAILLPFLSLAGCGSGSHTVQNHKSTSQPSTQKEERKTPTQSLMLKEVYNMRITDIATQRADVSHIISRYIPLGTSKSQVIEMIRNEFTILENSDMKLTVHHYIGKGHLGTRKDLQIHFFFDKDETLTNILANIDKSNNL